MTTREPGKTVGEVKEFREMVIVDPPSTGDSIISMDDPPLEERTVKRVWDGKRWARL